MTLFESEPSYGKDYFAYGSNLDSLDWGAFCRGYGADPHELRRIGPGSGSRSELSLAA